MRHSLRRGAAACVAVLALVGFAGCGNKTSAADAGATTSPAKAATKATTASFPFKEGAVDAKSVATRMAKAQQGLKTYHSEGSFDMTLDGTANSMTFSGDVDQADPKTPKSHVTTTLAGKSSEVVVVGAKAWVRTGGKWVAADSGQAGRANQAEQMSQWAQAATSADYKGDDATGHHFVIKLKPSQLMSDPSESPDTSVDAELGDIPADYWTDDNLVPVKVSMTMSEKSSSGDGTDVVKIAMTMSRFNAPVTIPKVG